MGATWWDPIAANRNLALVERDVDADLAVGQWQMELEPGTHKPTGGVRVRLGSVGLARELEEAVQGMPIEIGGKMASVTVANPSIHPLPKNG